MKSLLKLKSAIALSSTLLCLLNLFSICIMAVGPESSDHEVNKRIHKLWTNVDNSNRLFNIICEIIKFLPYRLQREYFNSVYVYAAPEMQGYKLNYWVNRCIKKNSKDTNSVRIYAIMIGKTVEEMRAEMEKDGF